MATNHEAAPTLWTAPGSRTSRPLHHGATKGFKGLRSSASDLPRKSSPLYRLAEGGPTIVCAEFLYVH